MRGRTGRPVDALPLQPRDAPRIGCGTTQTPAVRKDFRFLGRRLRGVPSGEGPDICQHFGCGVVGARTDPGPPRQDTSVESCLRGASRHGGVDRQSTSCGPGGSGLEGVTPVWIQPCGA